jgi:hypothetical protein
MLKTVFAVFFLETILYLHELCLKNLSDKSEGLVWTNEMGKSSVERKIEPASKKVHYRCDLE